MTEEEIVELLVNSIKESCKKIDAVISSEYTIRFKIGKSGDNPDTRKQGYLSKGYNKFIVVFERNNRALIDILEKLLISKYMRECPIRCDNDQHGGGELSSNCIPYIYIAIEDVLIEALSLLLPK